MFEPVLKSLQDQQCFCLEFECCCKYLLKNSVLLDTMSAKFSKWGMITGDNRFLSSMSWISTACAISVLRINTLRPRQNGRRFADDTFKCIFLNENARISVKISLKFVPTKGPINYIPSLVQIMAWRRSGDKPLSEPMMVSLLTHLCVTRPQWVHKKMQIC